MERWKMILCWMGRGKRRKRRSKLMLLVLLALGFILGRHYFFQLGPLWVDFPLGLLIDQYTNGQLKCYSREFIKEYSASHPESSGLKAVSLLIDVNETINNCLCSSF